MEYKLIQYTLNLKDGNMIKKDFPMIRETFAFPRDMNNKYFLCLNDNGEKFQIGDTSLLSIIEIYHKNEIAVLYVDNGKNTVENEKKVEQLLTEYINNRQKENETRYYQNTTENNNMLHSIKDMFSKLTVDFIEETLEEDY